MEISELFGLPAHPFIVHIPVVLVPVAALGPVLMVFSANWRARIGWLVVVAAGVSLVFVQLAIGSGEALEERVDDSDLLRSHADLGEAARPYVAVLFLAVLAFMGFDRARRRREVADGGSRTSAASSATWRDPVMAALAVVVLAASVLSGVWVYRAGHSGAESVWADVQGSGGEDDGGHGQG